MTITPIALGPTDLKVLRRIGNDDLPEPSSADIAELVGTNDLTAHNNLGKYALDGLVERFDKPDSPHAFWRLTHIGREILKSLESVPDNYADGDDATDLKDSALYTASVNYMLALRHFTYITTPMLIGGAHTDPDLLEAITGLYEYLLTIDPVKNMSSADADTITATALVGDPEDVQ